MVETEISPLCAEEPAHDRGAKLRMGLAFPAIHVGFAHVTDIVQKERTPEPRVEREAVQLCPSSRHE
jgi:hypothetical protein